MMTARACSTIAVGSPYWWQVPVPVSR